METKNLEMTDLVDSENTDELIKELAAKAVSGKQTEVWEFLRTLPEERKRFLLVKVRQLLVANSAGTEQGQAPETQTNGSHQDIPSTKEETKPETPKQAEHGELNFDGLDDLGQIDTEIKVDIEEDEPPKEDPPKHEEPKTPKKEESKKEEPKESPKKEKEEPKKFEIKKESPRKEESKANNNQDDKGKEEERRISVPRDSIIQLVTLALQEKGQEVSKKLSTFSIDEREHIRNTIKTSLIENDLLVLLNGENKEELDFKGEKNQCSAFITTFFYPFFSISQFASGWRTESQSGWIM